MFDLYIDDWIQENLFFLGEYEALELNFLQSTLKEGDVFIDIGANIGLYTLFASKLVGEKGKVISFEPFGDNFNLLQKNVVLNYNANIRLEKLAVSKTQEQISIAYNRKEANKGMASSYLHEFSYSELVDSISLDLYLKKYPLNRVNFIKIDIEGGEYPALLGMQETLKRYGPSILIEINQEILAQTPYTEQNIIQFFYQLGYSKRNLIPDQKPLNESASNVLFVRDNLSQ